MRYIFHLQTGPFSTLYYQLPTDLMSKMNAAQPYIGQYTVECLSNSFS